MAHPDTPDKAVRLKDGREFNGVVDPVDGQIWILVDGRLLPLKKGKEQNVKPLKGV